MIYRFLFIFLFVLGVIIIWKENIINDPHNINVLVNKEYQLPDNFIPNNLKKIDLKFSNDNQFLVKEACENFEKLSNDAAKLGYKIIAVSTYRSYNYQDNLFKKYLKDYGENHTLMYSAKPGHSEHQTGLAVDVMGSNNDYNLFEKSIEFDWMIKNSYKYGFILRYPKGKETITGFNYEPWHYRYVGKKIANEIQNKITLEEYKKRID